MLGENEDLLILNQNENNENRSNIEITGNEDTPKNQKSADTREGTTFSTAVINLQRMTVGMGICALPFMIGHFGLLTGMIMILLCGGVSYFGYTFYFEAQWDCDKDRIKDIIKHYLPAWVGNVFKVTFILDLYTYLIGGLVIGWNVLNYLLFLFGWYDPDWVIDPYNLKFNNYHPSLFLLRFVVMNGFFIFLIPLFLRKKLSELRKISFAFVIMLIFLILSIYIQAPFYYQKLHHPVNPSEKTTVSLFKNVWNLGSISFGFSILNSFYAQSQVFKIKNEIKDNSLSNLRKLIKVNIGINYLIYIPFALISYGVWGDQYTPFLIILRKPIDGQPILEIIFMFALCVFFVLNFVAISCFNPSLRDAWIDRCEPEGISTNLQIWVLKSGIIWFKPMVWQTVSHLAIGILNFIN